jgi:hypothetical protein
MYKFAHISDCHLGAWRDKTLRELNLKAFLNAMDKCVEELVDFIIFSGDLFDANIPDMSVVDKAVKKMKEVKDKGIEIYAVFGSHDYSPNATSLADVLHSAGLFIKVVKGETQEDGSLKLSFIVDEKTGAKLTGLSGRELSLDKNYFAILNRESLEKDEGMKIFVFHIALSELKPEYLTGTESSPISYLPKNFNYYAGGHIHTSILKNEKDYGWIAYPGALFGATYTDLEQTAKGEKRGFYVVSFDSTVNEVKHVEVDSAGVVLKEINVDEKSAQQAGGILIETAKKLNVEDKVALVKVAGTLSSGRPYEINFNKITRTLYEKGAKVVNINKYALTAKEEIKIREADTELPKEEIEIKLIRQGLSLFKTTIEKLRGESGERIAGALLRVLKDERKEGGETKLDYEQRIIKSGIEALELKEEMG